MIKKIVIIILFHCWATLLAQEPIRYTTKQGLPTNHVYDIAEDSDGFIWFATKQGLVKYDGDNFETLTVKDGLPNNDTWLLETDLQGRLWYFSKSAYQGYIKNDSIYKFKTKNGAVITPRFLYKSKDSLWFNTIEGLQTIKNGQIINTAPFLFEKETVLNNQLLTIQKSHSTNKSEVLPILLINPESKEISFYNKNELIFYDWNLKFKRKLRIDVPIENSTKVISNFGLMYNSIGYYSTDEGILLIDYYKNKTSFKSFKELVGTKKVEYTRFRALKNEFQLSTPGNLIIFDYNLKIKQNYSFEKSLSRTSYKDSNGNLWLLDFTNGVSLIPNTIAASNYFLKKQKVQKINELNNNIFAGISNNGFYKLDKITNTFNSIYKFTKPHAEVYGIKKDELTSVSYLISIAKTYRLLNHEFKELNENLDESFSSYNRKLNGFKDIIHFNDDQYFITTNNIFKKETPNESLKVFATKNGLLLGDVFDNQLFFGGSDGLSKMFKDSIVKLEGELLNTSINSLKSSKLYLFVGTDGRGMYAYNENELIHLKITDGLSIQRILQHDDTLWIATQKGVKKIEIDLGDLGSSIITDAYYESDGLLQNNTNDIYIKDSLLYAASDSGVTALNLNSTIYQQKPKLNFVAKQDTLIFKNGARDNINTTWALQDFVNQENIEFQYRLLPSQKDWTKTATKVLNFSNLSPNIYTLEVKATDQHSNVRVIKQYLNVIPEWWQTKVALVGFGLFSIGIFLLFIRYFKNHIRNKEREEAHQDKRVASLELQALRSQMNPHFVHNSLNAIQYYIQRKEVELSEDYLVKFSKLIRLFFEYSRRKTITISEELELLTHYLEIEKLRFEEKLDYTITVSENIDQEDQMIPSMLLQPLVENAVNHGLFHKQGNGIVEIEFKHLSKNIFQVSVTDDGIGINKAKEIYKLSSKNYQSNSSEVLHERLDLLNKSKEWKISYTIRDKSTINDGEGTSVILTFNQLDI